MSDFERQFPSADVLRIERAAERAIDLSYESALHNGLDIPVGAVALRGDAIIGSGYAIDKQAAEDDQDSDEEQHAEIVAIENAKQDYRMMPDLIVSTVESCEAVCQNKMLTLPRLKTVAFIIPRTDLSSRGLVNARRSMMERHARGELPFNVVMLDNPRLYERAIAPINRTAVHRTPEGITTVTIDQRGVARDKARFVNKRMLDGERIG